MKTELFSLLCCAIFSFSFYSSGEQEQDFNLLTPVQQSAIGKRNRQR